MGNLVLKSQYTPRINEAYRKQGYELLGNFQHSAVKICRWTKESLRNNRFCYKELWYPPVQSHRCMEMTPYLSCNCHCLHCWRLHLNDESRRYRKEPLFNFKFDEPKKIIDDAIEKRKRLLAGWKGNPFVDKSKFEESLKPTMMTMSLNGEPTLYPMISELVKEAEKRGMITFLVTNGTMPEILEEMNPLPFQLYVSVSAPNKKVYVKIVRPIVKNAWESLNKTLDLLPSLDTRKVIRLTMISGWNMTNFEEYAKLIEKAKPHFVEIKAYEWVGQSQRRLPKTAMPYMKEIEDFANKLSGLTGYQIKGRYKPSGAVLLA